MGGLIEALDDALTSLVVKKVSTPGVNLKTKAMTRLGAGDGLVNTTHERMGTGIDIKKCLRTHGFNKVHHSFKLARCSNRTSLCDVQAVFGADAEGCFFACEGSSFSTQN